MPKCENCYHYHMCDLQYRLEEHQDCKHYKDSSLIVELPCKPMPTVMQDGENESDVYCPECGTNLSGYYPDCEISVIPCFECGAILDNGKSITQSELTKLIKERENHDTE